LPTVLNISGYRFYFYSDEGNEPCHIHVRKGSGEGKIWMLPEIREEYYYGFTESECRKIRKIIKEHNSYIKEKWDEYFKGKNN